MKKRILSLLLAVTLMLSLAAPAFPPAQAVETNANSIDPQLKEEVDALLASKHKLTYNEDGSFRVMVLADVHMTLRANAANQKLINDHVKLLVDREQPDLVILAGDNIMYAMNNDDLKACLDNVVGYLEENQIPWCHVWGNHDEEHGMLKAVQQEVYQSYDYCVSKSGPEELTGDGNYALGVYKADGTLGSVVYCLDSGMYTDETKENYDYIHDDQIAWYKETSELLQQYNGGKVVPGLMAFHIPLLETEEIYRNRKDPTIVTDWSGEKNATISSSNVDTALLETILERGDVKAIVTGHDHVNSYCLNYQGKVKITACPTISPTSLAIGGDESVWGARIFDLDAETAGTDMPTYMSYVVEKPTEYPVLPDNTALNYGVNQIRNATFTNLSGGAISGTLSMQLVDGKGVGGSDAIELIRGSTRANFDISMKITNPGKLGNNKYLKIWVDFTDVDFRKACFGLIGEDEAYTTDNYDTVSPLYYLPDGATQWQTLSLGNDGCFGAGDTGSQSVAGLKGYMAFPIAYFLNGSAELTESSPITGLYFYGAMKETSHLGKSFYFDDVRLVVDYTTNATTASTLDEITEKVCTGEVDAYCGVCRAVKTWTPLAQISATTAMGTDEGVHYHYYLTDTLTNSGYYEVKGTIENGSDGNANAMPITVCLNLNGHDITNTAGYVFRANNNSVLNILGTGNVIGGKDNALFIQTATAKLHGAVTLKMAQNVVATTAIALVGNSSASDSTSYTPKLYMYDNACIDGEKTSRCVWLNGSSANASVWMYGGIIKNGTGDYGGNVRVQRGVFNMHGGVVSGGTAVNGGNFIINSANGELKLANGAISYGTASLNSNGDGGNGGNIWVMNGGKVTIGEAGKTTKPLIEGGSAASAGANIALNRAGSSLWMYSGLIDSTDSTGSNYGKNIYAFATIDGLHLLGGEIKHGSSGSNIYIVKNAANVKIELAGSTKVGQLVIADSTSYPTITVKKGFTGDLTLRHFTPAILNGYGPGCNIPGLFADADYANTGTITCTGGNSVTPWAYNGKFYGKTNIGFNNYSDNYTHMGLDSGMTTVKECLDLAKSKTNPGFVRLTENMKLLDLSDYEGHIEIGLNRKNIETLIIGPQAEVEIFDVATTTTNHGTVQTIINNGGKLCDVSHAATGNTYMLLPTGADGASAYQSFQITVSIKGFLRTNGETLAFQPEIGAVQTASVPADVAKQMAAMIEDAGVIISGGNGSEAVSFAENPWTIQNGAMEVIQSGNAVYNLARVALSSSNTNWWDQPITATAYIVVDGVTYECHHKTFTYLDAVMGLYNSTGANATMVQNMVMNSINKGVYEAYFAAKAPAA